MVFVKLDIIAPLELRHLDQPILTVSLDNTVLKALLQQLTALQVLTHLKISHHHV